jgi:predicted ABC-type ATPase
MTKSPPKLIIFAGANGSGKTTAAEYLLPRLKIKEFVNADEIARGLSPFNPVGQGLASGRLVLERMDKQLEKGDSFAIETTLSGNNVRKVIGKARAVGFSVEMHYIFCADINMNLRRIKYRVMQGGHHVPAEDVRRRYWRSLKNFVKIYIGLCDRIVIYDTTAGGLQVVAEKGSDIFFEEYNKALSDRFFEKALEAVDEH